MTQTGRRQFLKKAVLTLAGISTTARLPFTRTLFAASSKPQRQPPNDLGIVDLHCHPSLKMYLWNKKIWKKYRPSSGLNAFPLQYTVAELEKGDVKGILASHYLAESALKWSHIVEFSLPFLSIFQPGISDKAEHGDFSNFTQINVMIDTLETQVYLANKKQDQVRFVIARNFAEFDQAIRNSRIPIAHSIEGAHALGKSPPLTRPGSADRPGPEWYLRNLEALKQRGVCLMTIAHFFQNDVAFPVEGIAPSGKKLLGLEWSYSPDENFPLTSIGKIVVQRMLDVGMIVDLTHSTPAAREEVFKMNRKRADEGKRLRPLTFTHTGAQELFEMHEGECYGKTYDNFKYYGASNDEIDWICECDGTIGIIPENFWLVGCDTNLKSSQKKKFANVIPFMVDTIEYVNSKTRTRQYDNISIGTDFDGFTDASKDLVKPSQLNRLVDALKGKGISDPNIKKMMSGNALRLLQYGWDD
jgi:microsomal dipeptidase-like Zn-dependent dipeptidase